MHSSDLEETRKSKGRDQHTRVVSFAATMLYVHLYDPYQ